jgi:hypothetical protein
MKPIGSSTSKPELETTPIDTFTTVDACELLDRKVMVKKINENTLSHVKSLCRGIFSTAVRKGVIAVNPWREAKESVKVRPSKRVLPTHQRKPLRS